VAWVLLAVQDKPHSIGQLHHREGLLHKCVHQPC